MGRILGNGKRLFLKRDDLCGIGLDGNKVRKLEYLLAEALEQGCDCVVTGGGSRSNQPIATAACSEYCKTMLLLREKLGGKDFSALLGLLGRANQILLEEKQNG